VIRGALPPTLRLPMRASRRRGEGVGAHGRYGNLAVETQLS